MRAKEAFQQRLMINDAVDLRQVVSALWRSKGLILLCSAVGLALASFYLRSVEPTYAVEMRLVPPQMSGAQPDNQLSGIASLAGIDLQAGSTISPLALYTASIQSRETADDLSRNPAVLRAIFHSEWDADAKKWRHEQGLLGSALALVKQFFGIAPKPWRAPDSARLQEYIREHVIIDEDRKQPIITVRLQHRDPVFAVKFLQSLHRVVDERLRRAALQRTGAYITYLTNKLNMVNIPDYRVAIVRTLSTQERVRMMASANQPFAAEPLERPTASLYPTEPKAGLILAGGLLLGAALGMTVALLKAAFAGFRTASRE